MALQVLNWAGFVFPFILVATSGCGGSGGGNSSLPNAAGQPPGSVTTQSLSRSLARPNASGQTAYQAVVVSANPSAYFPMADSSTTLSDFVSGGPIGTYGGQVKLQAATFATRSGPAPAFPGAPSYNAADVASVPEGDIATASKTSALKRG